MLKSRARYLRKRVIHNQLPVMKSPMTGAILLAGDDHAAVLAVADED